jgi:CBS domain-containing protein
MEGVAWLPYLFYPQDRQCGEFHPVRLIIYHKNKAIITLTGGLMKAKDLMIPLREFLRPDNTLREAAELLRYARRDEERVGVKGLPVLDDDGKMIGFLSIGDILKAVFPSYMSLMNLGDFTWDGMVEDLAKKVKNKKVSEMMTARVITIPEDAPLMECVDQMIKNNVKRLPVMGKDGRVAGILYERDVFFEITKAMLNENNFSPGGITANEGADAKKEGGGK